MPPTSDFTLSQLRALISASSFPPDPVNGGAATTAQKNALINKVRESFYFCPNPAGTGALWLGARVPLTLPLTTQPDGTQTVTMGRGFGKIEAAQDGYGSLTIRNEWFRFQQFNASQAGTRALDDLGYGFCGSLNFPTTGSTLTIQTTSNEAGNLIALFGTNSTGGIISETLTVPTVSGNTVTSANTYYSLTQVVLPVTVGALIATQTTGTLPFAVWAPGETSPNYRRYRYNSAPSASITALSAICIRKYYPLIADTDPCEFGSVLAFEVGLRAYQWMQNSDFDHYRSALAEAISYLNGELAASQSESEQNVAQLEYTTSGGSVANIV